jgi:quinol monooxygenase YgiN
MIIEYVRYWIPFDQSDAFVAACEEAKTTLGATSHCLRFEPSRGTEAPERFILRTEWNSAEAYARFRGSLESVLLSRCLQPFLKNIEELGWYEPLPLPRR